MMQHQYSIKGMTCQNCVQKITKALMSIDQITDVQVDLESKSAMISMGDHVPTPVMQKALSRIGDYTIGMDMDVMMDSETKKKITIKDLAPLLSIFAVVITLTLIFNYIVFDPSPMLGMRLFMGIFFIIFGGFKVVKLKGFATAYQDYDLLAKQSKAYAYTYPFIELALGLMFLFGFQLLIANIVTLVIMSIGALGIYLKLRKGEEIVCACLGVVFKVPMTWATLLEDVVMAVMAVIMIVLM